MFEWLEWLNNGMQPRINPGTVYKEKIEAAVKEKEAAKAEEKDIEKKRLKKAESMQGLRELFLSGEAHNLDKRRLNTMA